ncbi:MAG: TonB-dependent receptor [Acidobacteria bacterium]|jgi:hypothetical protein|nr:TonB-dependent receptor [Acidobacteriota bacterium]
MKSARSFTLLAIGLLLCAGLLTAQQTSAKIFGTVQLEDGSLVPGVTVEATSPKLVGKSTAITDENGVFRLANLTPGSYKLVFTLQGFQTVVRDGIQLAVEQTLNLKITMKLGNIEEMVTITGQVAQIDVKSTAKGMTLTKEVFQTLPRGRNFDSLVTAVPGVSSETLLLGGTSVDGASGLENMYYIDGTDTTSIIQGDSGQSVSFDFVDEVQVKASGYSAEFGGSLGGVINVVTRSGGNEFHGEVVGYYSGAPLRSEYRDILDLDPNDDSKAVYLPYSFFYGDQDDHRFEGGLNLGGYILKDKLWFFGSILPVYYTNTRTLTHSSGDVRDWERTENQLNYQLKLTAQPMKNLRLGASVVNNFYKYKGQLANYAQGANPTVSYDDYGFSYPNMSGNFTADLTVGNNFMFSARAGFFRTDTTNQLVQPSDEPCFQFLTEAPGGYFKTTNIGLLDVPAAYQRPSGYQNYSRANVMVMKNNIAEKLSFGADLSYFVNLGGEHSWKAGFSWARRGQNVDNTGKGPVLFFGWNRDFIAYGVNYGRGKYGYYGVRNNAITGPYGDFYNAYGNMLAFYLQDSWTIANRFTVNFGVRAESEYIPSYATGNPEFEALKPIEFSLGDKLAPRLGFVWDVKGDSSLKVFGSYGLFFDVMKLEMAAGSYGGFKWKSTYYSLDTFEWDKIGVNGNFPGRQLLPGGTFDFRAPSFDTTDPDMKPMSQQEISLGLEKRLRDDLALSVRYVNKSLRNAIEDIGVLLPDGEHYYTANPGGPFVIKKYNEAKAAGLIPQNAPAPSKAYRDYNAVNISLDKRFSNNWLGGVSYTWSQLKGNYSGLASGDEVGRTDPNVARYFDSWYVSLDRNLKDSVGVLPGDRTHYLKAYGSYSFPFGVTAGMVFNAFSGTPTSTEWAMDYQGYLPFGRGDKDRAPFLWFANFYVEYNLKLGKNNLNINLNVDNIFNVKTAQRIYSIYNQGAVAISEDRIAQGSWDINDYEPVLDPRYLMEANFYGPLTARLGLKFSF